MLFSKLLRIAPLLLLAVPLSAARPDAGVPVRIHAGTVMVMSKPHATIFLVRNGDGSGPADHLFQLWANPGLGIDAVYRNADVEYTGAALVVVDTGSKRTTIFVVEGNKLSGIPLPEGYATTTYHVVGLNHETGSNPARFTVSTYQPSGRIGTNECTNCDYLPFIDPWGASGGCGSGGPGSWSCTIGSNDASCSVTCSPGYYACCVDGTPPVCSCRPN